MRRLPSVFIALLFLVLAVPARALNVVIRNGNPAYTTAQVYFTFRDAAVTGTIDGKAIERDRCYSLNEIGTGINLQRFIGGRIYFSLGAPLLGKGDPEPINTSVQDWDRRFDKVELTYSQADRSGVANLTAIDYFAIPFAMRTYAGGTATGTPLGNLTYRVPGNVVATKLAALAKDDPRVRLKDSQGRFLRVLGPTLSPAGVYPSMQPYLDAVRTAKQATRITGLYSHQPQSTATTTQLYDFTAIFDANGNLRLDGGGSSFNGGASVGGGHVILIKAADLAAGVYSANPGYTVDGKAASIGDNDVYSAVVRDILTGYALGFVNSATVDPRTGQKFKDEPSEKWWESAQAYGFLQSNALYYDQYAAYLQEVSGAYGHPFSDRWQSVQVSLDPQSVGTLELVVLPDAATAVISSVSHPAATTFRLAGRATPNATLNIQARPDLAAGSWSTLGTSTADGNGAFSYQDTTATDARRFYRAAAP